MEIMNTLYSKIVPTLGIQYMLLMLLMLIMMTMMMMISMMMMILMLVMMPKFLTTLQKNHANIKLWQIC